jgi:hypothetical protein
MVLLHEDILDFLKSQLSFSTINVHIINTVGFHGFYK